MKWVDAAASSWEEVFSGQVSLESQLGQSASRASLLTMTGLVLSKTPDLVPYQHGAGYSRLLINLIPRFLWPDKPTVNVNNQFFQVAYGLTDTRDLSHVSIACGFEAEGYMNYGWPGVVAESLFVGFVLGCCEWAFFRRGPTGR